MPPLYRVLAASLLLCACKPRASAPGPFCDRDLSGLWLNSSDKRFAYRLRDHGGVVRGEFLERQDDGGLTNPDEPILLELHRSDGGVAGVMKSQGPAPGGRICPVEYGFDVTVCNPDSLQAQVEIAVHITDECQRVKLEDGGEVPLELGEFRFERAPPSTGGEPPKAH